MEIGISAAADLRNPEKISPFQIRNSAEFGFSLKDSAEYLFGPVVFPTEIINDSYRMIPKS